MAWSFHPKDSRWWAAFLGSSLAVLVAEDRCLKAGGVTWERLLHQVCASLAQGWAKKRADGRGSDFSISVWCLEKRSININEVGFFILRLRLRHNSPKKVFWQFILPSRNCCDQEFSKIIWPRDLKFVRKLLLGWIGRKTCLSIRLYAHLKSDSCDNDIERMIWLNYLKFGMLLLLWTQTPIRNLIHLEWISNILFFIE